MQKLNSPGLGSFESAPSESNIAGVNAGIGWMIGIAEWGRIGVPTECVSYTDFEKKFGSYLPGYYLAKCANVFFRNGGNRLHVVRTAHYTSGVCDAIKASVTLQGYNEGVEDRTKVNTLKFTAFAEGVKGNRINLSNLKVTAVSSAALTGTVTYVTVVSETGFEIGDVVEIFDGSHFVRVVVTYIDTVNHRLYFKSMSVATAITTACTVRTGSTHAIRTALTSAIATGATNITVASAAGIKIGQILTIVDKNSAAPNHVTVKVTNISDKTIYFDAVGTITTIPYATGEVVSQEFNLKVYLDKTMENKPIQYISMSPQFEDSYIENKVMSDLVVEDDLASTEGLLGAIPEAFDQKFLTAGTDGLTGLVDTDFAGTEPLKNGLWAFEKIPNMFAQLASPDRRSATMHLAMAEYADRRMLWCEYDFNFEMTPADAKAYVMTTAMLNTNMGEINYPNVLWRNPLNNVVQSIPQSGATMGLNARVWSAIDKGPWIAAAGVEEGLYVGIEGFENRYTEDRSYRDLLYDARINALYRYPQYGSLKYGIRTLEVNGQFPQVPERVVFLYCRHSVEQGTPWTVFKLIDTANLQRLKRTIEKFLRGVWKAGGLKGAEETEAFAVDVSEESVNTAERQQAGEMWCKIGLATKKAGEFVYFEFHKKVA